MKNFDKKIAFRKILGSVSQKWTSEKVSKGGPFGSTGGRIPEDKTSAPKALPPPPPPKFAPDFEGEARAKKKQNFLVKIFREVPKTPFLDCFSKFCEVKMKVKMKSENEKKIKHLLKTAQNFFE